MLERMIIGFVSWFVRPLGYEIWPSGMVQDLTFENFKLELELMDSRIGINSDWIGETLKVKAPFERVYKSEDNIIKVDFKA